MDNFEDGILSCIENDVIMISKRLFEKIVYQNKGIKDNLWPDISKTVGDNVFKRCCANCQHSLMCKIKDYVLHEMLIDATEYTCNLFMLGKVNYTKKEV